MTRDFSRVVEDIEIVCLNRFNEPDQFLFAGGVVVVEFARRDRFLRLAVDDPEPAEGTNDSRDIDAKSRSNF